VTIDEINKLLAAVNPGYAARMEPAPDETVDPAIHITLHDVDTRWAIQLTQDGGAAINEYGFENGEIESSTDRGMFPNLQRAVLGLCALLEKQP
jgi:hypothetical protein